MLVRVPASNPAGDYFRGINALFHDPNGEWANLEQGIIPEHLALPQDREPPKNRQIYDKIMGPMNWLGTMSMYLVCRVYLPLLLAFGPPLCITLWLSQNLKAQLSQMDLLQSTVIFAAPWIVGNFIVCWVLNDIITHRLPSNNTSGLKRTIPSFQSEVDMGLALSMKLSFLSIGVVVVLMMLK